MKRQWVKSKAKASTLHVVEEMSPEGYRTKCGMFLLMGNAISGRKLVGGICSTCARKDKQDRQGV